MSGENIIEVAEDTSLTKNKSVFGTDPPYDGVAEWTFTDFDNNYYWGDSIIYFRHYRSPDGNRSNQIQITPDIKDGGYLVDGTLKESLLRFIDDKTYGVPIYKDSNGDLYKLNIEWY
ncbi:MAG: hypothetical protein K2X86_14585 [Cytophagaceae bacterium]|nr:hypothetical protein [Cytophagaceae bacterium]